MAKLHRDPPPVRPDPDPPARDVRDAGSLVEAEVEQFEREARRIAAGGWKRGLIGFAIGALAGVAAALMLPRDEGPRRRLGPADRPVPYPVDDDGTAAT